MTKFLGTQAVVVGGGMAGLVAAKALSAHFERVTVLERDELLATPGHRAGTPQSRHLHALLGGGLAALEELFPNFAKELRSAGAVPLRAALDMRIERPGFDPFPQRDLGWEALSLSRPLIEFIARQRVEREVNIVLLSGCRATEFVASADHKSVVAVRCETRDGAAETLPADLVVDASGRGALTLRFLERNGGTKPEETEIGTDQAYSTAIFERPEDSHLGWKIALHLPNAPASGRGASICEIENGLWMAGLGGIHGDSPPGDIEGFMEFAKSLRTSTIYDAIKGAKRVGGIERFLFPASIRRHFERIKDFPRGLIPIGDSICRFNPVFGQGMTVAAQEAVALRRLLDERASSPDPLDGLANAFFELVQGFLATPWAVAESDFVYEKTRGVRPTNLEQRMKYNGALMKLAAEDPSVHKVVVEVNHLMKPGSALRDPTISGRVAEMLAASRDFESDLPAR
jgi:2-polyprenyl-6-methoxyphenol hydroxylase-like FAD-dependent oxidoreductase